MNSKYTIIWMLTKTLLLMNMVNCFELYKVDKELAKGGLHRDMITNTTFRIDTQKELETCGIVFVEYLTEGNYIYVEDILRIRNFDFWPRYSIDIEKPASVSAGQ